MKTTKMGYVLRSDIVEHSVAPDRVLVTYEDDSLTLNGALHVIFTGGRVRDKYGALWPDNSGQICLAKQHEPYFKI